jgi:hypothetical protein
MTNKDFLNLIKTNIGKNDYHITLVTAGQHPDFSYTIGLTEKLGFELIIGGGFVSKKDNELIFRHIFNQLKTGHTIDSKFYLSPNDVFYLVKVDSSWSKKLMIGVYDYYNLNEIICYQIIPLNRTVDTPLMSEKSISNDPIWKWLYMDWNINAPKNSYVITNINSLKSDAITELTRWEEHVWEMFSCPGPDVKEDDVRIVPLGTILGIDDTLLPCINLKIGQGLWRDDKNSNWQNW